jgi:hypothetical protein
MKKFASFYSSIKFSDTKCMRINLLLLTILPVFLLMINSCITPFIPEITEQKELLVVQGLITDQPETYTIKLSKSLAFGKNTVFDPVTGCSVQISDDLGHSYSLNESSPGTYITDSTIFKGETGRTYTLDIFENNGYGFIHYKSYPAKMKPVPPIDSIYYEKTVIKEKTASSPGINGCRIYLDTHDQKDSCKFYRWDFSETWKLRLLFPVPNMICWISDNSDTINIKSTAAFGEARIIRHQVNYISNLTDRLKTEYSILVNQYSMNEDEYNYWEKVQNLTSQVGGLSDIVPSSIPSNIISIDNPGEPVLGYFSVSAKSSRRIFIKDEFAGIIDPYRNCITDTVYGDGNIKNLDISVWVLIDILAGGFGSPRMRVLTDTKGCADCTVRGTNKKPDFWIDEK